VTTLAIAPAAPPWSSPRAPRLARAGLGKRLAWIGATLLALEIFYVIAGNLFLRFGLLPIVNGTPETVFMAYRSVYTLWPGVAHVRSFRMRNQNRTIQWRLDVDEADVTVDLAALTGRTFRATRVRATGVAFRLRRKLDTAGAAAPRAQALPPIDGYEDPPLAPIGPDEPPVSDADYDEWTVHLDDVDALAREVWIDEIKLLGATRVRGGVYIKPERVLQLGPTTVDIERGEIRVGDRPAASPLDARIETILGAIDLNGPIDEALREISGHAQIAAHTPGIEFVRLYLGDPPAARLEGGSGSLHVDVYLANGRAMPRSSVSLGSDHLVVGAGKLAATLAFRVDARVDNSEAGPLATGDFTLREATLTREGAEGAPPRITDARAHFTGLPRDLVGPYAVERTAIDAPATIPDLRWLLPAPEAGLDRPLPRGGAPPLRARVDVDRAMRAGGVIEASARGVDVKTPSFQVRGRLATTARFHGADPATRSLDLDPSVILAEDLAVTRERRTHPGGALRVDVTGGRLDDGVPRDLALTVAATIPDFAWLAWKNTDGGDPSLAARTASVSAKLKIPRPASLFDGTPDEAAVTGSIAMNGTGDARFKDALLRGRVEATATIERLDLGRGVVHLRGLDVITKDLAVDRGSAPTPTRAWWGRFVIPRLDVAAKSSDTFFMHADARCEDGAPFLAVLASEGTIPGWTGALFPMKALTASGDLRLTHDKLDLGLFARGSSANVTARLHDLGGAMEGAVDVKTNLVSLGVGFRDGKSQVKILDGEAWLNARIAEANDKAEKDRAPATASGHAP
jgi:hypothetical protein